MSSWQIVVILSTIPRIDAKKFEYNQIKLKPKSEYKTDFIYNIIFAVLGIAIFFLYSFPYLGVFFFMGGILCFSFNLLLGFRNWAIWKNYEQIFTKENIEKLCKKN